MNSFNWHQGALHHFVNDELRAVVAADNLQDYLQAAGIDPSIIPEEPDHDQA